MAPPSRVVSGAGDLQHCVVVAAHDDDLPGVYGALELSDDVPALRVSVLRLRDEVDELRLWLGACPRLRS